jgi:hypothetical protein
MRKPWSLRVIEKKLSSIARWAGVCGAQSALKSGKTHLLLQAQGPDHQQRANILILPRLCSTNQNSYITTISKRQFTSIMPKFVDEETMLPTDNSMPSFTLVGHYLYDNASLILEYYNSVLDAVDLDDAARYAMILKFDGELRAASVEKVPKALSSRTPLDPAWPKWIKWARKLLRYHYHGNITAGIFQPQNHHDTPEFHQQELQRRALYIHSVGLLNSCEECCWSVYRTRSRRASVVGRAGISCHSFTMLATRPFPPARHRPRGRRILSLCTASNTLPPTVHHKLGRSTWCSSSQISTARVQQAARMPSPIGRTSCIDQHE